MTLWRRVMAERKGLVLPLLIALAVNVGVLALGVFPLQASVAGDEDRAATVKRELCEAQRLERLANDTRASQVRADQELKQFYSEVLPGSHAEARDLLYLQLRTIAQQNGLTVFQGRFEREPVEDSTLMRTHYERVAERRLLQHPAFSVRPRDGRRVFHCRKCQAGALEP